jgi:hypothetical protein
MIKDIFFISRLSVTSAQMSFRQSNLPAYKGRYFTKYSSLQWPVLFKNVDMMRDALDATMLSA